MQTPYQPSGFDSRNRQGAVLVELALCLPILLLLTFAAIEASNAIVLKQTLVETAYETARIATTQGHSQSDALQRANEILSARKIANAEIEIEPAVTPTTPAGTTISVIISAPAASNSVGPHWYFRNSTMSARVVMSRM
jgi:Flp pilus assembly protein TadG